MRCYFYLPSKPCLRPQRFGKASKSHPRPCLAPCPPFPLLFLRRPSIRLGPRFSRTQSEIFCLRFDRRRHAQPQPQPATATATPGSRQRRWQWQVRWPRWQCSGRCGAPRTAHRPARLISGYGWIPHNAGFGFLDLAPSILHSNWFWDYIS
jgi:hypothetical protein